VRLVQRGQRNQALELTYGLDIEAECGTVFHSAMDDAMADGDNLAANEQCVDGLYDLPSRLLVAEAIGRPHPFGDSGSRSIADAEARFEPDALDLAAEEQLLLVHTKQGKLDAGRTGIKNCKTIRHWRILRQ
jgi:hypothetical protein